ncbi:hypothetical protein [Candidatus Oscillochloris fontis]|uniref:hypothetical protein n=1 Tax=Candidatus Oscillochloris fontis TaxID=2496868 RepID=UPI00101BB39A|nr:hypothetical protein [Candidatus Oscillochloris fontis]
MERTSPLTRRVRRLLGTSDLRPTPPAHPLETSIRLESQVAQLSAKLNDLRISQRQHEAEVERLREELRLAKQHQQQLQQVLNTIEDLLHTNRQLIEPPSDLSSTATLFERMCARIGANHRLDPHYRETLTQMAEQLTHVRDTLREALGEA